jgi:small subunit ribosomal protein S18
MTATYSSKQKKSFSPKKRKNKNYLNQTLKSATSKKPTKIKKSLQYILLLKKFKKLIDYKNIKLIKAFLTKFGKIRPRRRTRIEVQQQKQMAKSIRKARNVGLIPFAFETKIA